MPTTVPPAPVLARFDSVIAPHDLTTLADRALPVVQELARRGSVPVHLVTTSSKAFHSRDRAELTERARALTDCTVDVVLLDSDDPAAALTSFALAHPTELVCTATHGRTALGELAFGSMTDELLRQHIGPMLVVGPCVEGASIGDTLLVCVDDNAVRSSLPDAACAWRTTFGGGIELVEAVAATTPKSVEPTAEMRAAQAVIPDAHVSVVDSRDPVEAVLEAATRLGGVIALASHLRHGVQRAIFGSVTWEVIRWSPTPVLVVAI